LFQLSFELGIGRNFTQFRNLGIENVLSLRVNVLVKSQETPSLQSAAYFLLQRECAA